MSHACRPGDFFKSHLDTPREGLIGSLVVCLPYKHTGGSLVVRHLNTEVSYDWGQSDTVQWAFFYSDCEHEVKEVTSGFRITLTYNLYQPPASASKPAIKHDLTPFGVQLSSALDSAAFLPNGGKLGFALAHLYPHTSKHFDTAMLKGIDAAILATAQQLKLQARVEPVWRVDPDWDLREEEPPARPQGCWNTTPVSDDLVVGGPLEMTISEANAYDTYDMTLDAKLGLTADDLNSAKSIYWVSGKFDFQLGLAAGAYGPTIATTPICTAPHLLSNSHNSSVNYN